MKTINVYVNEINALLPQELSYRARRALVPLGVNIPIVHQGARSSLTQRLSLDTDVSIALYFGRMSQASKCDLGPLLVALSQLLRRGKNLHLIMAGDDTQTKEAPRLHALAIELCCQKNVSLWPNPSHDEKHLLYSGADFFVSPSDNMQETFGLAVAEAMAYGLPVVVSDWNGFRDLVVDGENGFLVASILPHMVEDLRLCDCVTSMLEEDPVAQSTTIDVRALSERMEKLAVDAECRVRMGKTARSFVENNCSWRVVIKQCEKLWEESLKAAGAVSLGSTIASKLLNLSMEKCFGHYANGKRSPEGSCFITPEGRRWLKRPGRLYFLSQSSPVACPQKFASLLREISNRPGVSVREVVDSFSNHYETEAKADLYWALARLFKYGLLTDTPDPYGD